MPFYLEISKNITKQRDIYDTVIFRFLQIFYGMQAASISSHANLKEWKKYQLIRKPNQDNLHKKDFVKRFFLKRFCIKIKQYPKLEPGDPNEHHDLLALGPIPLNRKNDKKMP